MAIDINILIGDLSHEDILLFFGDNKNVIPEEDEFRRVDASTPFFVLLADLGIFKSRGDARRNGWDKPIPEGWTDLKIGKLKHRVCILKDTTGWSNSSAASSVSSPPPAPSAPAPSG